MAKQESQEYCTYCLKYVGGSPKNGVRNSDGVFCNPVCNGFHMAAVVEAREALLFVKEEAKEARLVQEAKRILNDKKCNNRPKKSAYTVAKKDVAKQFSITHRFGEEPELVLYAQETLHWILAKKDKDEYEQPEFWKNEVLTLSVGQGVDSGSYLILRIS